MVKIYHNPRCTKSRETLAILNGKKEKVEVVEYLKETPNRNEIEEIISLLGIKPQDLVRKSEPEYKEHFKGKDLTDAQWIDALCMHPKLLERPIVVKNGKAAIGRPPEKVLEIL